jgi:hypothetical protein
MTQIEKTTKAFTLSLTAGILILINAVLVAAAATWFPSLIPTLPGSSGNDPALLYNVASIGLICGVIVLVGALMLRINPANKRAWGIVAILFSIPSVVTGGGFIIGFILGIAGGATAVSGKRKAPLTNPDE